MNNNLKAVLQGKPRILCGSHGVKSPFLEWSTLNGQDSYLVLA